MSAKARPTRKGCSAKEQPVCDLCAGPFKEGEENLQCEWGCQKHMHRYCAGLTRSHYQQLSADSTPFVCLVCTQRLHKATVYSLKSEVAGFKSEITELKALLTTHACEVTHQSCTCGEAIDNLSDMQQLQLDVKRQASTYAETVKRGSGSKHKQHAEHHKNHQHKGWTQREKNNNGESNATPASLTSLESPNAQ